MKPLASRRGTIRVRSGWLALPRRPSVSPNRVASTSPVTTPTMTRFGACSRVLDFNNGCASARALWSAACTAFGVHALVSVDVKLLSNARSLRPTFKHCAAILLFDSPEHGVRERELPNLISPNLLHVYGSTIKQRKQFVCTNLIGNCVVETKQHTKTTVG